MALGFGRKKAPTDAQNDTAPLPDAAAPAPALSTPASDEKAADLDAFDLDAFDLDAFATQIEPDATTPQNAFEDDFAPSQGGSAFDFPESAPPPVTLGAAEPQVLDFNETFALEQRSAALPDTLAQGHMRPPVLAPDALPRESEAPPPPKSPRKLPLVPIVAALAVLGLAGGAATFLLGGSEAQDETAPVAPVSLRPKPAKVAAPPAPQTASAAPQNVTPNNMAPKSAVAQNVAVNNVAVNNVAAQNAVRPLAPDVKVRLKALWKQGADAKHRGDNDAARRIWQQGLQVQPGNRGFIESIAKLPK